VAARPDLNPQDVPREVMQQFMFGMIELMFLPATRSVITPADVAAESGLDVDLVRKVLTSFA